MLLKRKVDWDEDCRGLTRGFLEPKSSRDVVVLQGIEVIEVAKPSTQ